MKCLCGKEATHIAYLPLPNVFASTKQVMEEHPVCDYHAAKAKAKGYRVEVGGEKKENYNALYQK